MDGYRNCLAGTEIGRRGMSKVKLFFFLNRLILLMFTGLGHRWATQRIVFGKPLTSQAVIRAKLGAMISRIEACQNWMEHITHQMNNVR
jgi:hypothetical protein